MALSLIFMLSTDIIFCKIKMFCYNYLKLLSNFLMNDLNADSSGDGDDDFDDDASKHLSSGLPIPGRTRTLIVSRDPVTGYGLTLSGDQPVFVQTVKPGGAADRAGVKENDLILKVNGQPVVIDASHNEVVAMIQGKQRIVKVFFLKKFC